MPTRADVLLPRLRRAVLILALVASLATAAAAVAGRVKIVPPEGANWRQHAEKYLVVFRENRPFSLVRDTPTRCVKANNYGCLKQPAANWEGTPGPDGTNGAHDGADGNNGHAIFVHPKWSIVAGMRWFERRTSGGRERKSALELAEIYSPWCDTLGSVAVKAEASGRRWGRGCAGGAQPPAGFSGPRCGRPASGSPTAAQCQACNCPTQAAKFWLRGTSHGINDKLVLFDAAGKPSSTLQSLISWKIGLETGQFQPSPALMSEAAAQFDPAR
jgi:hypothetical protein